MSAGASSLPSPPTTQPPSLLSPPGADPAIKSSSNTLPQYGFGPDVTFAKLLDGNPYLFRIHTPKSSHHHHRHQQLHRDHVRSRTQSAGSYSHFRSSSPGYDSDEASEYSTCSEPLFVGSKYQHDLLTKLAISSNLQGASGSPTICSPIASSSGLSAAARGTYADVIQHMDWTTRSRSPYISTSFSFAWAIWEAIRRYHVNVKHDIEIAVIDARAIADRAVTAVELLTKGTPKDRHKDHWKWYRYAVEAQDVLVWGQIPNEAVLASIPLLQIVSKLPTYFLLPDISAATSFTDTTAASEKEHRQQAGLLHRLSWDYTRKKPSFRQFCQAMSDRFLRMPVDKRLRDTTVGSVRLALCFLRPYVHKHASDDSGYFTHATKHVCDLAHVIACWPSQWWAREHPEIKDLVKCVVHVVGEEMREARRVQAVEHASRMQEIVSGFEQLARAYEARARAAEAEQERMKMMLEVQAQLQAQLQEQRVQVKQAEDELRLLYEQKAQDRHLKDASQETEEPPEDDWSMMSMSTLAAVESKGVQTDPVDVPPAITKVAEPPSEQKDEREADVEPTTVVATDRIVWSPFPDVLPPVSIPSTFESAARTASCFLTAFCVGSVVALCMFSSHRRELATHLT